jgi:hypothetical protein
MQRLAAILAVVEERSAVLERMAQVLVPPAAE